MSDAERPKSAPEPVPAFPRPRIKQAQSLYRDEQGARSLPAPPSAEKAPLIVTRPDPPEEGHLSVPLASMEPDTAAPLGRVGTALRLLRLFAANHPGLLLLVALPVAFLPFLWLFLRWLSARQTVGTFAG